MTVTNTTNRIREQGNGAKVAFDFPFKIFNASELEVFKVVRATDVTTLQTITTDYTVSINTVTEGGTVTFVVAPTALEDSLITRKLPLTQNTDLATSSKLPAVQLENTYDVSRLIDIQQQDAIDRSLILPITTTLSNVEVPINTTNANKFLQVNADGDGITATDTITVTPVGGVNVSADDNTAGTLEEKITAGTGITLTTNNPGGNENRQIDISNLGVDTAQLADDAVTLAKLDAGTAGNLITYDASGNPAAVATGTAGQTLTSNGAGAAPTFQATVGVVKQVIAVTNTTEQTIATALPADTTIPQNTEGGQIFSQAITPTNGSSEIIIEGYISAASDNTSDIAIALFQDSTADAVSVCLAGSNSSGRQQGFAFLFVVDATDTTARTYSIRAGKAAGSLFVNRNTSTSNLYGTGKIASTLTITEVST